jgi:high-affinity iron transporter
MFMLPSLVLSLREGLEAALIIGLVLSALRKLRPVEATGGRSLAAAVWLGAGSAAILSLLAAVLLTALGLELEGPAEAIFEALTMALAAGILTWMVFWMNGHARHLKNDLETGVRRASAGSRWSLFGLAFLSVLREGLELALYLTAAALTSTAGQTVAGTLLGLGAATVLGWSLFATSLRLDLRRFFQVTGIMLVFFAAGLVAHCLHEFNELGWIPGLVDPVWDASRILSDRSVLGQVLATLFGYTASPSLTEVLAYAVYFAAVMIGLRAAGHGAARGAPAAPGSA